MQKLNFNSTKAEPFYPQRGESFDYFYQINNPQLPAYQYGFQSDQFSEQYFESEEENPGIPFCSGSNSDSRNSLELEAGFQETCTEESEALDELLQILTECMKKAGIRTQEILLRKFFSEIEKDTALEGFLLERIKNSKINSLLCESLGRTPCWEQQQSGEGIFDRDDEKRETVINARGIDGFSAEEVGELQLERFKVKTVQVGNIVKEEPR